MSFSINYLQQFKPFGFRDLTKFVCIFNLLFDKVIYYTTPSLPVFLFFDAGVLVCTKPDRADKNLGCPVGILHPALIGLPRQQWLQQLYGQGY